MLLSYGHNGEVYLFFDSESGDTLAIENDGTSVPAMSGRHVDDVSRHGGWRPVYGTELPRAVLARVLKVAVDDG